MCWLIQDGEPLFVPWSLPIQRIPDHAVRIGSHRVMLAPLRPFLPCVRETVSSQPTLSFMAKVCHLRSIQGGGNTGSGGAFMTFDEVLDQVLELLQRQGRVSYRALKMRFNLDDEYLDVLKEEMLFCLSCGR
jgi:hypothetical protein